MKKNDILKILNKIKLFQCGWEGNADIMIFNGKPIGMTISKHMEIDRWWPELKEEIAEFIVNELNDC